MALDISAYDHPSWRAILSTAASYGVVLAVMTVLLFGIPYALFYFL
ncbi:MAG: hypothetical protein U5K28_13220 [Halobacteriales archaeon]|nr:hypothetical protein [Halobacteriales archaeon]